MGLAQASGSLPALDSLTFHAILRGTSLESSQETLGTNDLTEDPGDVDSVKTA